MKVKVSRKITNNQTVEEILHQSLSSAHEEIERLFQENKDLRVREGHTQDEIKQLKSRLATACADRDNFEASFKQMTGWWEQATEAKVKAEQELHSTQIELADRNERVFILEQRIEMLEQENKEWAHAISALKEENAKYRATVTWAKLNAAQEEVARLREEVARLTTERDTAVKENTTLIFHNSDLEDELEAVINIKNEYAEQIKMFQGEHDFAEDIIACAMNISKRYMGSKKRAETLEQITTTIYDSMKKIHGMGTRERLYLRLATILHDCGKYISLVNIGETSYKSIMATEMIGLSHAERELVANVVRFNHSKFVYMGQGSMNSLTGSVDRQSYLTIAKLTAILRLANSLDRSHKQKLKTIKAMLKDDRLILSADTMEDVTLEKRYFENSVTFFREVFSIEPIFKQKKNF